MQPDAKWFRGKLGRFPYGLPSSLPNAIDRGADGASSDYRRDDPLKKANRPARATTIIVVVVQYSRALSRGECFAMSLSLTCLDGSAAKPSGNISGFSPTRPLHWNLVAMELHSIIDIKITAIKIHSAFVQSEGGMLHYDSGPNATTPTALERCLTRCRAAEPERDQLRRITSHLQPRKRNTHPCSVSQSARSVIGQSRSPSNRHPIQILRTSSMDELECTFSREISPMSLGAFSDGVLVCNRSTRW